TIKLGTDIFITPKNTITLIGNYSFDSDNHSFQQDGTQMDLNKQILEKNSSISYEDNKDNSLNLSLNYKRRFDKKEHAFSADATFSRARSTEGENITQSFFLVNKGLSSPFIVLKNTVNADRSTNANIELNYSNPFGKDSRYEIGYQGVIRNLDNDARYETFDDSIKIWQEDKNLNNLFIYKENIHAIFGTYANFFGSFRYQMGVRLEQAYTNSDQQTQSQTHRYSYFSFFPSLHITYKLGASNDMQLSYSRRVNRPGVWSLNPFRDISDPLNVRYGNPYLKPEYINSVEFGNNKSWETTSLVSTVFYRQINDVIKRITFLDSNGVANSTSRNLTDGKSYGVEFIIDQTLFKWWRA
ncbi:MAG: outer membrane beta-barrel family protein, partial [Ignavibacteria bacterium]|nr:outer membrane beta-barrel family protein [Ignavibacteria bacterium]